MTGHPEHPARDARPGPTTDPAARAKVREHVAGLRAEDEPAAPPVGPAVEPVVIGPAPSSMPTRPGPQPWNAGITPGYRRPRPDDAEPARRGEVRELREQV